MTGFDSGSAALIAYGLGIALLMRFVHRPVWRKLVLFFASLLFILLLDAHPLQLVPLGAFVLLGYLCVVAVRNGLRHKALPYVVLVIASYAWLKQYNFLPQSSFLPFFYETLGLSYIFFRVLHLLIEGGASGPARDIDFFSYLTYVLNFTTLISGPIQRFEDFGKQIDAIPPPMEASNLGRQIERIVLGFFKVNVLALLFNMVQVDALAELARDPGHADRMLAIWKMVTFYPFFLYCNFSGYIDIVLGIAELMGISLPENFNRPFSAASFIDFWNRWHITLSTWLKTYVYNPLLIALMRRFPDPALEQVFGIFCFFITFFLVGIWHGRTAEFAFFGLLQGGGVALNKLWQVILARLMGRKSYRALANRPIYITAARGLTFSWFAFSLIWFWGDHRTIARIFNREGALGWLTTMAALWLAASILLAAWEALRPRLLAISLGGRALVSHPYFRTAVITAALAIAFVFVAVLSQPAPGIVYRTF